MSKVKVPIRTEVETDLHPVDAFRVLCYVLEMPYVLNEFMDFTVHEDEDGEKCVFLRKSDGEVLYDERGELFIALRRVALCIAPNLGFKDAEYLKN